MKKVLIIIGIVLAVLALLAGGVSLYALSYYKNTLNEKGKTDEIVEITVTPGMSSNEVVNLLYNANLVKNKYVGFVYMKTHDNIQLQAGTYEINRNMSFIEMIDKISKGKVIDNSITVTFVEGKRITYFAKQISKNFPYTEEEVLAKLSDKSYLEGLVKKYWFLTDEILNDRLYYALEGYLYPSTYYFRKDASLEDIIFKLLEETNSVLSAHEKEIRKSEYSVHELLTMASIVELEGGNSNDRRGVAGVFYNRLNNNWSLGSDVTTYYAAKIEMSDRDLYQAELDDINDYNTRTQAMAGKLPIGPICNPSSESIEAALYPEDHEYFFFVADKNKETYFSRTNEEHVATIRKLREQGLWYEYR